VSWNRLVEGAPELSGERREARICGPQSQAADQCRRQKVRIDRPNPAAVESSVTCGPDHLMVRYRGRVMHQLVVLQPLSPPADVRNEEFSA